MLYLVGIRDSGVPVSYGWRSRRRGTVASGLLVGTTGRLGCSIEGGGKRRIFAIFNYVNQRLLRPVHDWLMQVLRRLPMDEQVYPGRRFMSYAVLGDDVVIADQEVASVYEKARNLLAFSA
ncbi:hypothetical protein L6164_037887 [Bauhinia variegata]|uniref:Uncharacterized protein n=2 Tax=Bauhinia variegata TaxID=167791 RepID=A0ACB9KLL0_BAUVA|nr:hypothetical protein L6164_037833 [Bauhinia variegata]KAI4298035.1 hypothetical protein L6164_037887 [Bauhinia variegata]